MKPCGICWLLWAFFGRANSTLIKLRFYWSFVPHGAIAARISSGIGVHTYSSCRGLKTTIMRKVGKELHQGCTTLATWLQLWEKEQKTVHHVIVIWICAELHVDGNNCGTFIFIRRGSLIAIISAYVNVCKRVKKKKSPRCEGWKTTFTQPTRTYRVAY